MLGIINTATHCNNPRDQSSNEISL